MSRWISKLLDLRPGEARPLLATFASLLLIVVGHTILETARDALFLVHVGAATLGWMYIVAAAATLVAGGLGASTAARLGARRALTATQLASAFVAAAFYFPHPNLVSLTALYASGAVIAALLVPQLWATAAGLFHVGQARRVFGVVAIAGVLGAVLGSGLAALALTVLHVRALLPLAGLAFAASALVIRAAPEPRAARPAAPTASDASLVGAVRAQPILLRIALVVVLGTVVTLLADYLFKAVAVSKVPPHQLGSFLARAYTAMNLLALVVQLVVARRLLARAGVVATLGFTPTFMFFGSAATLLSGGAHFAVIGTKIIDAATRHSVYRTGLELVYLAVPARARDRVKPIIDGALTRVFQAAAAGLVLVLIRVGHGSVVELALLAALGAAGWVVAAAALRGPYVALFRRALLGDSAEPRSAEELDLASIELLVEAVSSPRGAEVIAAIDALGRRGRSGLVPALVLLREEEDVLVHALDLFGGSQRGDWRRFAERLLTHRRERVQRAAMRALARVERGPVAGAAPAAGDRDRPWIQGYLAIQDLGHGDDVDLAALLDTSADAKETALGMLTAFGDATPSASLAGALEAVLARATFRFDRAAIELAARAGAAVQAAELVPWLVDRLEARDARAAVRVALVALGQPAFDHLATSLEQGGHAPVRVHLPLALAEFRSQRAADRIFACVRGDDDGFLRYRALRALERMVAVVPLKLDLAEVRRLVRRELVESLRVLAAADAIARAATLTRQPASATILERLLREKSAQALVRAFRFLKLLHPAEDIQGVRAAIASGDERRRANAVEFLDALLAPGRRREPDDALRPLLRLAIEDLADAERLTRAAPIVGFGRIDPGEIVARLRADVDPTLAGLALDLDEGAGRAHASQPAPADTAGAFALAPPLSTRGT